MIDVVEFIDILTCADHTWVELRVNISGWTQSTAYFFVLWICEMRMNDFMQNFIHANSWKVVEIWNSPKTKSTFEKFQIKRCEKKTCEALKRNRWIEIWCSPVEEFRSRKMHATKFLKKFFSTISNFMKKNLFLDKKNLYWIVKKKDRWHENTFQCLNNLKYRILLSTFIKKTT